MDKQIVIIENEIDETKFTKNLEDLLIISKLTSHKHNIVRFIKNNFKENIDYIIKKVHLDKKRRKRWS